MIIRLIITYILNLFDLIMTKVWVKYYGINIEGNPIGIWILENNIDITIKVVLIGIIMLILYICIKYNPQYEWTSWLILIVYSLLAIYHSIFAVILFK